MSHLFAQYAILWAAMLSWIAAQVIKLVLSLVSEGRINLAKLIDSGGMPSSHSALVGSLCLSVGMLEGWASTEFAIAAVFSAVVVYDATGIRRSAGEHAAALNDIIPQLLAGKFLKPNEDFKEQFKEVLGHNPLEVIIGLFVGVVLTLLLLYGYDLI